MARTQQAWHISAVEVFGFKSVGPQWAKFNVNSPHLVGIVGPNGCGKSNLLEALCFATGCSTAVLRGCRQLKDVTSSDAGSQLPAVRLHLTRSKQEQHLLETNLTSEGARVYRIDGKLKSGTHVKDFLRARGIVVDSTTVIQQASVTRITDSNNPATLADLVAAASDLNSWNQETAAARNEITRTRRALSNIQANIAKVQAAAAADEAAIQAGEKACRLEQELEGLLEKVVSGLQLQQVQLQQAVAEAQQQQEALQVSDAAAAEQLQQLTVQRQQLATQQAHILADLDACSSSSSCSLVGDIAAAEAKVAALQAASATRSSLTAELLSCKQELAQQQSKAEQLKGVLHSKQRAAAQAASSLAAVEAAGSATESLQQQALEVQKQAAAAAAALAQQQAVTEHRALEAKQAQRQAAAMEQRLQSLGPPVAAAAVVRGVTAAKAAAVAAAAAADSHAQQLLQLQQQQLQLQMDVELSETSLTSNSTAAVLSACRSSSSGGSSSSVTPLHKCFQIKDASNQQAADRLLTALSVIAGPSVLQVLVSHTMRDANQLLAAAAAAAAGPGSRSGRGSSGRLKIWPLDNLRVHSILQAQRAAQQQLGVEWVVLPADLLEYDRAYESAIIRAFGGYVIAADDATAAVLVEKFGLSSVTLQGTVSRKGSMSGGWVGSSGSFARSYWISKLQHDAAAAQAAAVRQQLAAAVEQQQLLEERQSDAHKQLAETEQRYHMQQQLQQLQAAAEAASTLLLQEQHILQDLQQRHKTLQVRLQQCRDALQSSSSGKTAAGAAAVLKQQQQEDARRAAAEADVAAEQLQTAEDWLEQLSARMETMELQLCSMDDAQQKQEQLQQHTLQLQQLRQQQEQQQTSALRLQEQLQQLQTSLRSLDGQLQQVQQQQQKLQQQQARAAAEAAAAAASLKQSKHELKQLAKDFASSDAVHALLAETPSKSSNPPEQAAHMAAAGNAAPDRPAAAAAKDVQQLIRKARRLQQEAAQLEVPELPAAQKELMQSRVGQVVQFRQQMAALAAAADTLEGHITSSAEQVHAANDAVYEDIAAGFSQLCSSLLPALELQLQRTGEQAHQGLQFRFRRLEDQSDAAAAADARSNSGSSSGGGLDWQTSLSQLSGGQQTLVSLAMLLAVARTGNSSRLFLMDEIDAALDEHNQTRAAALLKQLSHAADGGGCQIMCVTHNVAFQQACDAFVQVVRGPQGSMPATAGAQDGASGSDSPAKQQGKLGGAAKGKAGAGASKKARAAGMQGGLGVATASGCAGVMAAGAGKGGSRSTKKVRFAK